MRSLFIVAMLLLAMSLQAHAYKRVALVIGNSAYQNVRKAAQSRRDASAIAEMFKKAGFDVVALQQNVGNLDFKRAVRKFEEAPAMPTPRLCSTRATASKSAASIT